MKKFLAIVCIIATLCSLLVSCGGNKPGENENKEHGEGESTVTPPAKKTDEELIETRINAFVAAYNNGDMNGTLACLTAKQRNAMKALLKLLESLTGSLVGVSVDLSDLFSFGVATGDDTYIKLKIEKIEIENSLNAVATATMNLGGECEETIYVIMAYENGGWYIEDMTDKNEPIVDGLKITSLNPFSFGTASIQFEMNEKSYSGIINTSGKIIYYNEKGSSSWWRNIGNGYGLVISDFDNPTSYTWYNSEGKIIKTMPGDAFDEILSWPEKDGDPILVYKNTSTLSKEEHSYGLLDHAGNWIKPLTAEAKLYTYPRTYRHVGDGIFITSHVSNEYHYLYNSNSGESHFLSSAEISPKNVFSQGVVYARNASSVGDYPNYFAFYSDGTIEAVPAFNYAYGNLLINTQGEYMSIYDNENKTTHLYKNFPKSMINSVIFENNLGLVTLYGADRKKYFTVIDKECNQKFDPIVCQNAYMIEGKIVYSIPSENEEYIYEMLDTNGNIFISKENQYTYISNSNHGIILVTKGNESFYMDKNGNTLTIKFENPTN